MLSPFLRILLGKVASPGPALVQVKFPKEKLFEIFHQKQLFIFLKQNKQIFFLENSKKF